MTQGKYADIIIDISHEKVDRPFQYKIPEGMYPEIGSSVMVPFGKGNTPKKGYCIDIGDQARFPEEKLKEILSVGRTPSLEADAVKLAAWMKHNYGSTMIAALKTVLPVKQEMKPGEKKKIVRRVSVEEVIALLGESMRKHQKARERILRELSREPQLPYELVTGELKISPATLNSLTESGIIAIERENYYRNPVRLETAEEAGKHLSSEQKEIAEALLEGYDCGDRRPALIHGITGSGKTEVYLALIEGMIKRGKQCIMLIPEIALTYQTLLRFYKRFGDRVSVMNSTLSKGEKYDQCERAKRGELDVIIGPRSALFVPFPDLGMIIMDEEHESSYKSETMPRYHARETAEKLCEMKGACLILGSATPSLETYYRASRGEYKLFRLSRRLAGARLPQVYTVDLREELKSGNRLIFSRKLQESIRERLEDKEQVMLFLNRRGYAGFVSCRSCGEVMKCPHCDVSLSQHRGNRLVCHYCGYETRQPAKCPSCSSPYILGFKAGTQQIEEQLNRIFPEARVLRMDADTTRKKGDYEKILSAFAEEKADILVGTQMIVKGHDFPSVTLVGILAADLSLNDNDYRCAERTFQLLTQAAGRAGRGKKEGEAIIQTYRPEHYAVIRAAEQNYEDFYQEELLYRELAGYPPIEHMLAILLTAEQEKSGEETAARFGRLLQELKGQPGMGSLGLIGPSRAPIAKINDRYRFVLYCKSREYDLLTMCKDRIEKDMEHEMQNGVNVQFDFDPV